MTGGGAKFQLGPEVVPPGQISVGIASVSTRRWGTRSTAFFRAWARAARIRWSAGNTAAAQTIITDAIGQVADLRGRLGACKRT